MWYLINLKCCSVAQSCPTLCDPTDCSMSGFPVLHCLPEFAQTHVHWAHDPIQPSYPLLSLFLLLSIFPSIGVFSNELALYIRWPVLESQLQHQSFQWTFRLVSFRMDWFDLLAIQGTLKSVLQHHSLKAAILWCPAFFMVQLSHPYMTTGKTIAFTIWTFRIFKM